MSEKRADSGLAFMLQYENVAWYDDGCVRILDRRIYPAKTEFVECRTYGEVAQAVRDMVTQSAGPYTAAAMGMALAAYECREKPQEEQMTYLQQASETIANARPTTASWRQASASILPSARTRCVRTTAGMKRLTASVGICRICFRRTAQL